MLVALFIISSFDSDRATMSVRKFDPTGTYKSGEDPKKLNRDIYAYFGEVRIKLIDKSKIAISLYVLKGAPSYSSGSFVDTLHYQNQHATYLTSDDSSCKIEFLFNTKGLTITQYQQNLNFGCGFGHGVLADGYYPKISENIPVITDLPEE
jgi:hypothetical protein